MYRASSPTYRQPTSVSRSTSPSRMGLMPSLRRRLDALDLSQPYDIEDRPPFVVRKQKASASLIGRLPGEAMKMPQYPPLIKSRGRSGSRSQSRNRSRSQSIGDLTAALDDYTVRRRYRVGYCSDIWRTENYEVKIPFANSCKEIFECVLYLTICCRALI